MAITIPAMTAAVKRIEARKPSYKLGHSGGDGFCDCIGLIMGALQSLGYRWPGIHGTNWTARNMGQPQTLSSPSQLREGDWVLKSIPKGSSGWNLPARYAGSPDQRDYYHVGYVASASPLVIIHCTGPGVIRDTRLGKWNRFIRWSGYAAQTPQPAAPAAPASGAPNTEKGTAGGMKKYKIVADHGRTVNVRANPSTGTAVLTALPIGTEVRAMPSGKEGWLKVEIIKTGYIMEKYLQEADGQ